MISPAPISDERLARALRTVAGIVASKGGDAYVPLFERLESEVEKRQRAQDARARARALAINQGDMRR